MRLNIYGNEKDGFSAHGESDGEYLERCPFCGGQFVRVQNTHSPSYWGECEVCGAQGPSSRSPRRVARSRAGVKKQHEAAFSEAVRLWNTREAA